MIQAAGIYAPLAPLTLQLRVQDEHDQKRCGAGPAKFLLYQACNRWIGERADITNN